MGLFSNSIKWLLYTSIFAALCAVGLSIATERLLLSKTAFSFTSWSFIFSPLHIFIFSNTIFIYNVHYGIKRLPEGISDRADWSRKYRYIHWFLIALSIIVSGICLLLLNWKIFLAASFLGILSLGYSLPILPFKNKKRLKDFGILKLILLCFVWACVTTLLPMLYWNKQFESYEVEFFLRFTLMMPLCIAFDIRDMHIDKENSIFTLPNAIGLKNAYRLIDFSLLANVLLAVWQFSRYPIMHRFLSALAIAALTKLIIIGSKKYNSDFYHLLLIDGVMLLYALMIIL